MSELSVFILNYLRDNNMSRAEFASKLGVPLNAVNNWICYEVTPHRPARALLASTFGYTLEEFENEFFRSDNLSSYVDTKFTQLVVQALVNNKYTYVDLAHAVGIKASVVYGWMSLETLPIPPTVPKLASVLKKSKVELASIIVKEGKGEVNNRFGYLLMTIRLASGVSLGHVRKYFNVPSTTWGAWEHGHTIPGKKNESKICSILGIDSDKLKSYYECKNWKTMPIRDIESVYNYMYSN